MSEQSTFAPAHSQADADGHRLAGLTDGEGCFTLYVRQRKTGPSYMRIDFGFKLSLRADDAATVQEARRVLGVNGTLYSSSASRGPNGKPITTLAANRKSEIKTVIGFFRRFPLRSKKARDFAIWSAAFDRFAAAIRSETLQSVTHQRRPRRSRTGIRRPVAGTPRQRFKVIPPGLLRESIVAADELRSVRAFA